MQTIKVFLFDLGAYFLFLKEVFSTLKKRPPKATYVVEQIWKVFYQSFLTTSMSGFFVGAIMTVQFAVQIKMFGALGYLGGLSTSATVREVGPLLIAFLLSGKVGAYTSAELGSMKVSEQIDAIRCLGANPIQEIILPRFLGIILASFFLLIYGIFFAFFGGMLMSQLFAGASFDEYIRHIPNILTWTSISGSLLKSIVFAFIIASLCTFYGFSTSGGAKSVGRAVVSTAVASMFSIVIMDWFTSLIMDVVQGWFL